MAAPDVDPAADVTDVSVKVDDDTHMCEMQKLLEMLNTRPEPPVVQQLVSLTGLVGMHKVVEWGMLGAMEEAANKKKKPFMRVGSMMLFTGLVKGMGRAAEPYLLNSAVSTLPFQLVGDRHKAVKPVAAEALDSFKEMARVNPTVAASTIPAVIASLHDEAPTGTKVAALEWLTELSTMAAAQVGQNLPELIRVLSEAMHDMNDKVIEAAVVAARAACSTVDNRDVLPFVDDLVAAMQDPGQIPECIAKLASLTFVSTVETPALAVVVPLLHRGLSVRKTATQRMVAVIVNNMSKLVEDPVDAAPFLPQILPALEKAADSISDPEARGVCARAVEQLMRIRTAAETARPHLTPEVVKGIVEECVGEKAVRAMPMQVDYVAALCYTLVRIKVFEASSWAAVSEPYLAAEGMSDHDGVLTEHEANEAAFAMCQKAQELAGGEEEEDEDDDLEDVCDTVFTLAYGTKILLHNTRLNLKKGARYGLLGPNQSGKSTLLRSIANGSVEDFPPADELRCVFVEADIQGEISHLSCLEYVFADEAIQSAGVAREEISRVLMSVGFTEKMLGDAVTTLSGGWRMKLALSRAMLQKADVLLMDEPTNHLDVLNVAWVEDYLCALTDVTCIIVSHHAGLLDKCCTHMMNIENLKLTVEKGNMTAYAARHPEARAFFELSTERLQFHFPQPGPLEGVKSKGRALMKMDNVQFTYPGNDKPTLSNVTVQLSLLSRVACVGVNGAGKSTLVKLLTGEMNPSSGVVWQHPNARIAYVAQHAFHYIESHLELTPTQYIMWRYANGEDKEAIRKDAFSLSEEEKKKCQEPITVDVMVGGTTKKMKRVVKKFEDRRPLKRGKGYEYEVSFVDQPREAAQWLDGDRLWRLGFQKMIKAMDARCLAREGMYKRPLTSVNVEKHCANVGLEAEVASHTRMGSLSGGEKVKVVLAACTWNQPHIIVLDEPTNYLDRDALGALAGAIKKYEGGILMVTHNDAFCSALCPESWVVEGGGCDVRGDVSWMAEKMKEKVGFDAMETMVDAAGNTSKVKTKKTMSRKERKKWEKRRKAAEARGEVLSDDEEFWATGGAGGPSQ